jgi:hypothetical protein
MADLSIWQLSPGRWAGNFTDSSFTMVIAGAAADDAAISGNPVPVGGKYETTPETLDNGDVGFIGLDSRRNLKVTLYSADTATPVGTAASPLHAGSPAYSASATFTPAAASHTAGDSNGTAQEFAFSAVSGSRIMITSASIEIDGGTAEASAWRVYLFNVTPPSALADDAPFTLASGDRASFLGYVDIGTAADVGDTQYIETHSINKQVKLSGTSVFGYLVNLSTVTPANVAHIVTLNAVLM